jgi:hypothetical protein
VAQPDWRIGITPTSGEADKVCSVFSRYLQVFGQSFGYL